ncbi:MAG: mechanosensitive ion channel [Capsulimonadales bacterium]|nr:mechanosensitive ion channel [Capsulimonadales bacterium]
MPQTDPRPTATPSTVGSPGISETPASGSPAPEATPSGDFSLPWLLGLPTPTPAPTTAPSPSPAAKTAAKSTAKADGALPNLTRTIAEEIVSLPILRDLPFKVTLMAGIELILLGVLFVVLRRYLGRIVLRGTETIARRAEGAGDLARAGRVRSLAGTMLGAAFWTLGFLFLVFALKTIGVDPTPLLGTASVVGIAVGLGAQKLAKDTLTGFFILLEDQYVVGDYVTISGVTGIVEQLGIRTTTLRDDDGKLYILSNGDITTVCNHSRGPVAGSLEIPIAASADPEQAMRTVQTALDRRRDEFGLSESPKMLGVTTVDAAKTVIKIGFNAPPNQRPGWLAPRLRAAARAALVDAGIPLGGP